MEELLREVDRAERHPPGLAGGEGTPNRGSVKALASGLLELAESLEAEEANDGFVLLEPPASPEALARAAVPAGPDSQPPLELSADTVFTGALLRRVRESRGLSVAKMCDKTRIAPRHLENIEGDRYAELPVTVYLRGMLVNLARELALDPAQVSRTYLELAKVPAKP